LAHCWPAHAPHCGAGCCACRMLWAHVAKPCGAGHNVKGGVLKGRTASGFSTTTRAAAMERSLQFQLSSGSCWTVGVYKSDTSRQLRWPCMHSQCCACISAAGLGEGLCVHVSTLLIPMGTLTAWLGS
jgi:hypothetical protein